MSPELNSSVRLIKPFQHTSREKENTDTGTEERKISGGATSTRSKHRHSRFAHECSNQWAITPQFLSALKDPTLDVTNVSVAPSDTLAGNAYCLRFDQISKPVQETKLTPITWMGNWQESYKFMTSPRWWRLFEEGTGVFFISMHGSIPSNISMAFRTRVCVCVCVCK